MTETTEEKDPFEKAKTHICGLPGFSEYFDYIRARKGHQPPTNDFLYAVSKYITSLTKERDELKAEVDDLNYRAEEDERTIINHEKEMDALESQLSNREEEIKELKEALKKITELEHQASEPFSICDADYNYVADQDRIIADAKSIALASLQSKEGEE